MTLRAVVVEDQPVARRHLRTLLGRIDGIEWVGEAADGHAAIELIERHHPDLLFLDVEIPGLTGIEVLRRLSTPVLTIFTTAYDRHAVTAFELQAIDYLLKPFGESRLRRAVARARELAGGGEGARATERAAAALASSEPLARLFVRARGRIVPVALETVEHVEAQGDYVALWEGRISHLVRVPMTRLVERLDADSFLRVHRSHVVNVHRIAALVPGADGRLEIELESGKSVPVARSRTAEVRASLSGF